MVCVPDEGCGELEDITVTINSEIIKPPFEAFEGDIVRLIVNVINNGLPDICFLKVIDDDQDVVLFNLRFFLNDNEGIEITSNIIGMPNQTLNLRVESGHLEPGLEQFECVEGTTRCLEGVVLTCIYGQWVPFPEGLSCIESCVGHVEGKFKCEFNTEFICLDGIWRLNEECESGCCEEFCCE